MLSKDFNPNSGLLQRNYKRQIVWFCISRFLKLFSELLDKEQGPKVKIKIVSNSLYISSK